MKSFIENLTSYFKSISFIKLKIHRLLFIIIITIFESQINAFLSRSKYVSVLKTRYLTVAWSAFKALITTKSTNMFSRAIMRFRKTLNLLCKSFISKYRHVVHSYLLHWTKLSMRLGESFWEVLFGIFIRFTSENSFISGFNC